MANMERFGMERLCRMTARAYHFIWRDFGANLISGLRLYVTRTVASLMGALTAFIASQGLPTGDFVLLFQLLLGFSLYLILLDLISPQLILSRIALVENEREFLLVAIILRVMISTVAIFTLFFFVNRGNLVSAEYSKYFIAYLIFGLISPFLIAHVKFYKNKQTRKLEFNLILQSSVQLGTTLVCFWTNKDLEFYVSGFIFSYLLQLLHIIFQAPEIFQQIINKKMWNLSNVLKSKNLILDGFFLLISSLGIIIIYRGTTLISTSFLDSEEAKSLLVFLKIIDALFVLPGTFVPLAIIRFSQSSILSIKHRKILLITIITSVLIGLSLWFSRPAIYKLFELQRSNNTEISLMIFLFAFVLFSVDCLYGSELVAKGKNSSLFYASLISIIFSLSILLILHDNGIFTILMVSLSVLVGQLVRLIPLVISARKLAHHTFQAKR